MKEFIDKLIERLEEQKGTESDYSSIEGKKLVRHWNNCVDVCKEIINELAEEYKDRTIIDGQYCWQTCSATEHCKECNRLCNGSIDYYENYDFMAEEYKGGWIPCERELPEVDKYVLCQGHHSMFIACVDSLDNKWRDSHYIQRTNVKAWMPLPAPYTEGE